MFKGVAWEQISGLVQRGLMFGAGFLVAKGWISEAGATQIVGGLIVIFGTLWSIKVNTTKALTTSVKDLEGVKGVVTDNTPSGRALAQSISGPEVAAAGSFDAKSIAAAGDRV